MIPMKIAIQRKPLTVRPSAAPKPPLLGLGGGGRSSSSIAAFRVMILSRNHSVRPVRRLGKRAARAWCPICYVSAGRNRGHTVRFFVFFFVLFLGLWLF